MRLLRAKALAMTFTNKIRFQSAFSVSSAFYHTDSQIRNKLAFVLTVCRTFLTTLVLLEFFTAFFLFQLDRFRIEAPQAVGAVFSNRRRYVVLDLHCYSTNVLVRMKDGNTYKKVFCIIGWVKDPQISLVAKPPLHHPDPPGRRELILLRIEKESIQSFIEKFQFEIWIEFFPVFYQKTGRSAGAYSCLSMHLYKQVTSPEFFRIKDAALYGRLCRSDLSLIRQ
jgi:hypothetical protein